MRRLLLALGATMALAGTGEAPVRLACLAEGKATVPGGLCADMAARLGARVAEPADLRLVVLTSGGGVLTARLDRREGETWVQGMELGAAVADAPMGPAHWGAMLDLLAATRP